MDPDAALARLRAALAELEHVIAIADVTAITHVKDAGDEVIEAFGDLDDWLSRGRFAPAAWTPRG